MDAILKIDLLPIFYQEIERVFPSALLQTVALFGLVAILLLFQSNRLISSSVRNITSGFVLGIACFALFFLMHDSMGEVLKPVMVVDFLFIAGVFGGGINAIIVLCFAILGRYVFGGAHNIGIAAFDYMWIAVGGIIAHRFIVLNPMHRFNIKNIFQLVGLRLFFSCLTTFLIWPFAVIPDSFMVQFLIRRIISAFTLSFFIIAAILFLLNHARNWENRLHRDLVSGLENRRAFQRYLEAIQSRFIRRKRSETRVLLLLDIKNFPQLTQVYGHDWMDGFCKKIAIELRSISSQATFSKHQPTLFSFSESSFILVLENTTKDEVQANSIAKDLFSHLSFLMSGNNSRELRPFFAMSVIDIIPGVTFDAIHFLRTLTLLEKQQTGQIQFYEPDITKQVLHEEHIRNSISSWIKEGNVPMGLQPKVNLQTGCCYGAEALLRMGEDSSGQYINPHDVLRVAEKYNMGAKLEWAIVSTVVDYFEKMPSHLEYLTLSINLTPDVFAVPNFAQKITSLLEEKKIPPSRIVIELIETSKIDQSEVVQENIQHLINYGICLSLDDFGTGYSSMSLLSQYQFKELKLDYSMISRSDDPRVYSAIQLSFESATRYDADIVAEGIETETQLRQMLDIGVSSGQGYLFGRAMILDKFIDYVINSPHTNIDGLSTKEGCLHCRNTHTYYESLSA